MGTHYVRGLAISMRRQFLRSKAMKKSCGASGTRAVIEMASAPRSDVLVLIAPCLFVRVA